MGWLAATAYAWAHSSGALAVPSQVVTILWMGLSALLDGVLTFTLIWCFWRSRSPSVKWTNDLIRRMIALTLETVLLTHICGAVMIITFLSQPSQHRTKTTAFWICLEIITELYALSVVFTINARSSARRMFHGSPPLPAKATAQGTPHLPTNTCQVATTNFADPSRLDFAVEGMQDISRFSYHFPAWTSRGAAASKVGGGVGVGVEDELLELSVLPFEGDLELTPIRAIKELGDPVSDMTSEDYEDEVKSRRKSISVWDRG
ncbi:hypothetical protein QFC21_001586 [Naganishia friedmannii]|uniref:Uncharacterized protein n=1 Tax=Naganishia friedmannii TaxID=89922 RepID=A0ACC2W5Q8_9TREE|nr:hypothetical protein QFC21_001586 [Naganishia friedmannii]